MLDTKSLIIALVLILVIGCTLHLVNWRIHRDNRGAKWWTIGLCLHTSGLILAAWQNSNGMQAWPVILAINYLSLGGTVVLIYGTARFAEQPLPRAMYGALIGFITIGIAWFTLVQPSATLRIAAFAVSLLAGNALVLSRLPAIARRDGVMGVVVLATSLTSMFVLIGGLVGWQFLTQPDFTNLYGTSVVLPLGLLSLIACETTTIFGYLLLSASHSQARLQHMALDDALTDLPNRRAFEQEIARRLSSARKHDQLFALAIFDIDHFKKVNDVHGHDAGDAVLRHLGVVARHAVRPHDFIARVGGEEFAVIFEVEDAAELVVAANRLRLAIEIERPRVGETEIPITVSVGAVLAKSAPQLEFGMLYRAADRALYQAKATGRNRVVIGEIETMDLAA